MVSRRLLCGSFSVLALAACNALVGFDDFERVRRAAEPAEEEEEPEARDAAPRDAAVVDPPVVEAGPDAPELASTTCPASAPAYYPAWKFPGPRARPCTPADLTTFITHEGQSFESQKAAMAAQNAACASCAFTLETDNEWGPIVKTNDGRVFVSFGHCYARAGAPDACGDSALELEWCLQKICNVCTDGQSLADCRLAERDTGCKRGLDRTLAACGNNAQIINNTCRGSGDVVGVLCGGK